MGSRPTLNEVLKERNTTLESLVAGGRELTKQLRGLTREDKATVVALVMVSQFIGTCARSRARSNQKVIRDFYHDLTALVPATAGWNVHQVVLACRDESLAYGICRAKCENEGRSDEECERHCTPQDSAEQLCISRAFLKLRRWFPKFIRDPFPPPPPPIA